MAEKVVVQVHHHFSALPGDFCFKLLYSMFFGVKSPKIPVLHQHYLPHFGANVYTVYINRVEMFMLLTWTLNKNWIDFKQKDFRKIHSSQSDYRSCSSSSRGANQPLLAFWSIKHWWIIIPGWESIEETHLQIPSDSGTIYCRDACHLI